MPATIDSKKDYSRFDSMSNEVLEGILYIDSLKPENSYIDPEAALYITTLLAKREQESIPSKYADADAAWKSFNKNYRPYADGSSLYDLEDEYCDKTTSSPEYISTNTKKPNKHWRKPLKIAIAVAAVIAALFAGTIIASANGYNIWEAVASWTKDTFGFSTQDSLNNKESTISAPVSPLLEEMSDELEKHNVNESVLPSHIPSEFTSSEFFCADTSTYTVFSTKFISDLGDEFYIKYTLYYSNSNTTDSSEYQKSSDEPVTYEVNGVKYYIMQNDGCYSCTWVNGKLECNIYGLTSKDELYEIIDSMNGV